MRPPIPARHYILVCTLLGVALGWVPRQLHGPTPEKFEVLLAMPRCGAPCMQVSLATAAALGFVEAGLAYALTGLHRAGSREPR